MSSHCHKLFRALSALVASASLLSGNPIIAEECCGDGKPHEAAAFRATTPDGRPLLRIAADPNNLPFSNQQREGFENKIAELIAHEMGAEIEWTWRAQRRGFFRETLKSGANNLVIGVPSRFEMALTTKPYYRSSYAFVYRKDRNLNIRSLDDPELRNLTIGVQVIGDDFANTPPAHALTNRGMIDNIRGYSIFGDYSQPNPPARIVEAVAKGEVDVAIAWGPLAGYFAKKSDVPLEVVPVSPQRDPKLPFAFDISMGVRKQDAELKQKIEEIIERKRPEIEAILDAFGIPRVAAPQKPPETEGETTALSKD